MAKLRSPNYPNRNLEAALGLAEEIFAKDGRNKISRFVLVQHLGHEDLSGPALGKIGALRAYGIIVGTGDELQISDDAIAAMKAPMGSNAKKEAIRRLALNPPLFQDIRKEFPGRVSIEQLTFWLIQAGFQPKAAPIASRTYFETMEFAGGLEGTREPDTQLTQNVEYVTSHEVLRPLAGGQEQDDTVKSIGWLRRLQNSARKELEAGERELTAGMLSKTASFRLLVIGNVGPKEIDRLILKLQLDRDILADVEERYAAAEPKHPDNDDLV